MKIATDPRGDILHLVTEPPLPTPGGPGVATLCKQRFVSPWVRDHELDAEVRSKLCLACARSYFR